MRYLLAVFIVLSAVTLAHAETEEIELTTYYPAPYGDYEELEVKENAYLATNNTGKVGIGVSSAASPAEKLEVIGSARITSPTNSNNMIELKGADANIGIELRSATTPYIDFSNDAGDFDARFILTGDDLVELQGATLSVEQSAAATGAGYIPNGHDANNTNIGSDWSVIMFQGAICPPDSYPAGGYVYKSGGRIYATLHIHGASTNLFEVGTTYGGAICTPKNDRKFLIKKDANDNLYVRTYEIYLHYIKIK